MQYEVHAAPHGADLAAIEQRLLAADPSALLDRDPANGVLRIASVLGEHELSELFRHAGTPLSHREIVRLPSQCCGGCGG